MLAPQASLTDSPPELLRPSPDRIPAKFTTRPQWVCWRIEARDGKPTKVPYTPGTNRRASSIDLMTWRTFEEAVEALNTGGYDGLGFVLSSADPFVGIDLDDCRNPETGEIEQWAQEIIESVTDRYVEVSPSGRGVHVITRGTVKNGVNTKWIEVYGQDRYLTMTGAVL